MAQTAMGDYGGPYDETSYSSPEITNKTNKAATTPDSENTKFTNQSQQIVEQNGEKNVLNGFRSVTYNWTLAGLDKNYLKDPDKYRTSELDFIILKSGGKGYTGITAPTPNAEQSRKADIEVYDRNDAKAKAANQEVVQNINKNSGIVDGFNKESPGRFDMFIENVEIESLMTFTPNSGSTLPTQIKFEVIEPYSINGFIEALHVAAIAAGYSSYLQASFVLKLEFWGYPDDDVDTFTDPIIVPKATRYFPIGLTGIEVDISEKGTRYRCSAVPHNERAFGEPNVIKKPIKMVGSSVGELLGSLMLNINAQVEQSDKDSKTKVEKHDRYFIKFVEWSETEGWKENASSKIATSKIVEIFRDSALFKMVDPATTEPPNAYKTDKTKQPSPDKQAKQPESVKFTPGKTVIQFAENMNIHEAISSVIRDSEYSRNILKDIKKSIDPYGMVDYFTVRIETTAQDVIDEASQRPFQDFTYVVSPYKIHYTKIPNYGASLIKDSDYKKLSNREYNYVYTGQNVDVLNFKLNFNTLFFEAVPASMGNKDVPGAKNAAGSSNNVEVKTSGTPEEQQKASEVPSSPVKVSDVSTQVQSTYGGNAGQPLDDPYSVLAKNMHNAVINSKASMVTGDLEILGDPFYVCTGGAGNYNPKPAGQMKSVEGEALHNTGQVLITINFRNPDDINSFEDGGMMRFDPRRVPFSGVYMVTKAASTFRDGTFKQKLEVIRMPGQILDANLRATDPADKMKLSQNADDSYVADASRSLSQTQRMDDSTAYEQLGRGLPSPGLPGVLSNFTGATGGLGGTTAPLMNQTFGLVSRAGTLMSGASPIGSPLPVDVASNIRMNSSNLAGLTQNSLGTAALVAVATNVLTGNIPAKRAVGVVAGAVVGGLITTALSKPNVGSGIGEGATVSLPNALPAFPTANDIKFGANLDSTSLPVGSLSNIPGTVKELGATAVSAVAGLGAQAGEFVNGVGSKISAFMATPADPKGIAAQVGIDSSALSGLGANLQSKVPDQIANIVKNTPENVDLVKASNAGLALNYIPTNKIANIPATAPYTTAPPPAVDSAYLKEVVAKGGIPALENLYGVNNIAKISDNIAPKEILASAMSFIPSAQVNPFSSVPGLSNSVDLTSLKDKMFSANSQLSGITGQSLIPDRNVIGSVTSQFGSSSIGSSPLDKLVNKLGDPNAPPYTGDDPIVRARLGMPPVGKAPDDLNNFYG
jgi:hypothetical protein